jgi:hypothetical protein
VSIGQLHPSKAPNATRYTEKRERESTRYTPQAGEIGGKFDFLAKLKQKCGEKKQ